MKKILIFLFILLPQADAQNYELSLDLTNFSGQHSDAASLEKVALSDDPEAFYASVKNAFIQALHSLNHEFMNVTNINGISFKNFAISSPEINRMLEALVDWTLTHQQPENIHNACWRIRFDKTYRAEEISAYYAKHNPKKDTPEEIIIYLKKIDLSE